MSLSICWHVYILSCLLHCFLRAWSQLLMISRPSGLSVHKLKVFLQKWEVGYSFMVLWACKNLHLDDIAYGIQYWSFVQFRESCPWINIMQLNVGPSDKMLEGQLFENFLTPCTIYLAWKSVLLIEAKYLYRLAFLSLLYFLTDSDASSLKTATWRRCPDGQLFFLPHHTALFLQIRFTGK